MSTLKLVVALAASAALAPVAAAQTVSDPDPYAVPPVAIAGAAAAGAQGAPMAPRGSHLGSAGPGAGMRQMHRPPPGAMVGHAPGQMHGGNVTRFHHNMRGGGGRFGHISRINRGGFVPSFWWGPQFVVQNWGMYGFPQPYAGTRWIRYYDDALLIDREGRVRDGRYGYEWDRYQDRWGYDRSGIPVYVGDGDFQPERWDYEWAENCDRNGCGGDEAYAEGPDYGPPPPGPGYGPPPPPAGYHQGYGYGYGATYGYGACSCGPVVVTETTVTTAPVVEQVTYYDYVTERAPAPRVKVRTKRVKAHRVAPYPGERG
ncbi:hypothetical protein E2493_08130 [Sphingomonas parva]|uniref:RcnB family protein n=1 Tax=Sphingomonas parva TaxID=2555898 RepID=A0A4Y8ZVR8_9SPHN|nr:RcnB family protein [Sphingomonas parva]TFI58819.1 hypothetical protein E2493_08130 [Sphingomonas parva]